MAKQKVSYSDAPEWAVFVSIYCDGHQTDDGPSHRDDPWRIATFAPSEEASAIAGYIWWSDHGGKTYITADRKTLTFDTQSTLTHLVGDRPVSRREAAADPGGLRSRTRLSCRTCGLTLTVRSERLNPALTKLHAIGVSEVSLVGLRTIVVSR